MYVYLWDKCLSCSIIAHQVGEKLKWLNRIDSGRFNPSRVVNDSRSRIFCEVNIIGQWFKMTQLLEPNDAIIVDYMKIDKMGQDFDQLLF